MTMYHAVLVTLTLCAIRSCSGFIAFDCGTPITEISNFNAIELEECVEPIPKPKVTQTKIQLLQSQNFHSIPVKQCKIEVKRLIYHCGMLSHISMVNLGLAEYIEDTSREACLKIFHTNMYNGKNTIFNQIPINGTTSRAVTFAGTVTNEGTCQGERYSDYYGSCNNVIVTGVIKFMILEYDAQINLLTNQIVLRSGVRCTYLEGHCLDTEGGNTYWDVIQTDQCKFSYYNVLYEGPAENIRGDTLEKLGQEIYSVAIGDTSFALAVSTYQMVCGYKIQKTEHPTLFIIDDKDGKFFTKRTSLAT
ncbi:uncharacterized protein [Prorops nasuta]|uniref:uncharacterized protein n=1 Tax=Prorops nasuta TaxID=863751 RepID=UPI0034CD7D07